MIYSIFPSIILIAESSKGPNIMYCLILSITVLHLSRIIQLFFGIEFDIFNIEYFYSYFIEKILIQIN